MSDLLRSPDGIDTEDALLRVNALEVADLRIPVLALDELLANKRAAGRPRDLADVVALERARRR